MANRRPTPLILILWGLVVVAGMAATVLYMTKGTPQNAIEGIGGGEYSLVSHTGKPLDQTMLEGHPSLLFFGFTHCPDVCPTTMAEMQYWFEALGDDAKDLRGYFVTVDPARDTPEIIGGYVTWVSERMTGVTGSQAEIDKIVKAWRVFAEKVPTGGDGYTMNHTASVFLLNNKGQFVSTISYGENVDTALKKIRKLLDRS